MQLSKNFALRELTASQTAIRKGIDNSPNRFDEVDHIDNNPQNNSPSNLRIVSRNKNRTRSHNKRSR